MDNKQQPEYDHKSIENMYRGYGAHYTSICRSMADILFNWAFALNTGGVIVTVTFMGSAIKWDSLIQKKDALPFIFLIIIFSIGILLAIFGVCQESSRFEKKGKLLDKYFTNLDNEGWSTKQVDEFLQEMPPPTPVKDCFVKWLQRGSFSTFFAGLIYSVVILWNHIAV